ncbi:uncharacterized protein [Physcomitrium patens]|nr:enkurin domain-containing protein 1-like [Physcomitrium patens]|eukprot:XP_024389815.1 enkurin domain-containing protein 1-like [Physcomitrella patens]
MALPSHLDSYQVSNLFNPPRGIRDEMLRRGITPRDHHRDNKALVARTSAKNHALRQNPEALATFGTSQEGNVEKKPKRRNGIDYVSKNVKSASNTARDRPKVEYPNYMKKENFGKVPSYLLRIKTELAHDTEKRLLESQNKNLPPGLVLMEEADRIDVLNTLKNSKEKLETQLMNMPLVIQTSTQKRNKSELELQLQDLEKSISRFSRPKVYIRLKD